MSIGKRFHASRRLNKAIKNPTKHNGSRRVVCGRCQKEYYIMAGKAARPVCYECEQKGAKS